MSDVKALNDLVVKYNALKAEIGKVIIGQHEAVNFTLLSILCGGHSLLVGVPGLAKTLLVNTVSDALGLNFKRIQFTPDLMPSDILGSEILDENRHFKFIKGPIFSNIILADEINRTPPKTQAALLEAMQERSVTVSGNHYKLDLPFFVLATQNPIEQEGTYPLPEAQLDRFMFSIYLEYPSFEEEVAVVKRKSYEDQTYWGKPIPGFGSDTPKLLIVGLAPGAHGANRTGRIFTGDSSGDWLYKSLHKNGLAKIPTSKSKDDGQELINTRILCAVRCAPPDNKPSTEEKNTCAPFYKDEIALLMPTARSFLALGNLAWTTLLTTLAELDCEIPKPKPKFGHGATAVIIGPDGIKRTIIGSYHPSQQNTFTGKLTEKMLDSVIKKASRL